MPNRRLLKFLAVLARYEVKDFVFTSLDAQLLACSARVSLKSDSLLDMQDTMKKIYDGHPGVVTITTDFLSIPELTKRVAQIIHRDKYEPANLMAMMKGHEASGHATA